MKDIIKVQSFLGNLQIILFTFVWSTIVKHFTADVQFKDFLKCYDNNGKILNSNSPCCQQYSDRYFWPISLRSLALFNWILVLCTWVIYILHVISRNHDGHTGTVRLTTRNFYVLQILCRAIVLLAFIVLIGTARFTNSGFNFPAQFNCQLQNDPTGDRNTCIFALCTDRFNNERNNAVKAIQSMDIVFFVFAIFEFVLVIREHSYPDRLKAKILRSTQNELKLFYADKFTLRFDDIFTELLVYHGQVSHKLKQHDLYDREGNLWNYAKPESIKAKLDNVEDLVKPLKDETVPPRNILVIGRAGIGKTMFSKKLIRGWAYKNILWKRYDYVFLLNFRQLNSIKKDISLCQLLAASPHSLKIDEKTLKDIIRYSEKVLVIFDGLDEFLNQDDCKEAAERLPGVGEDEAMPVPALYYKLCTGELLPQATIVTTTRASKALEIIDWDRTVEILGFDKTQIEEFVRKFCQDPKISEAIIQHITSRPDLLAYCYIPVNCFLLSYCLQSVLETKESAKDSLPTTLTQLYERILRLFVSKHYQSRGESIRVSTQGRFGNAALEEKIDLLSKVAYEGIKERRLVFDEEAFEGFKELTSCGIIHEMQRIDTVEMECGPQFIFLHLTVQEFLAARYVVKKLTLEQFEAFVSSAVDDSRWEVVFQFIAGLLSPSAKVQPEHTSVTSLRNEIFKHLKKAGERKQLLLVKSLFEYHDVTFLKNECSWESGIQLDSSGLNDADCTAISFVFQHIPVQRKVLSLQHNYIGSIGATELTKLLISSAAIEIIDFSFNNIGDEGVKHLKEALQHSNCELTSLNLSNNKIGANGAKHLKEALQHSNCKLTSLDLRANNIGADGVKHLKEALHHSNCKLTSLDLSMNNIGADGVKQLKEALQHSNCKLTSLDLRRNNIGADGVKQLKEALQDSNCKLTSLELRANSIGPDGVKQLKEALQHRNCELTSLNLSANNIGADDGVNQLKEALQDSNCKLTSLELRGNNIGADGVKQLKEALRHSNCKLTSLDLTMNKIGAGDGLKQLKEALQHHNCKLTSLDLRANKIGDDGVEQLKEALQHSNCKLTSLNLIRNNISVDGVNKLKEALQHRNCQLLLESTRK